MNINVKLVNKSSNQNPAYEDEGCSGMDLRANEDVYIAPNERKLVSTGLFFEIPEGYEGQVRPRSGNALKKGITVLNTPGTIDSSYRGEVKVILFNTSDECFHVEVGDRIAQIVFAPYAKATLENVDELSQSVRGEGGFGHSGVK